MKKDTLIIVGTTSSALIELLEASKYNYMHCPTVEALPSVVNEFLLVIFSDSLIEQLQSINTEQLSFYTNRKPAVIFTTKDRDFSNYQIKDYDLLYDFEIKSGTILTKINNIIQRSYLFEELFVLKSDNSSTESLQKELSLRDSILSHERHINSNILSSITSGLIILGLDGDIIVANSQAEKICSNTKIVGSNYKNLPNSFVEIIDSIFLEKDSKIYHEQLRKCSIGKFILRIHGYFIKNDNSKTTGILLLINDITEEENINQLLYRSEKLATVGTMLSGIAHELRNPLSIISARTQMITLKKDYSEEVIKKGIDTISKQAVRCGNIVNSLLNLTRTKTASSGFHEIRDIITETLNYVNYQNSFDNITVENHYDNSLLVYGDRARIVQVLLNLISNAVDAMDECGVLTISTSKKSSNSVLIQINDTGSGIDPVIGNKLFDPFFTTKEPGKGTGLGLSIVHKIVTEINGLIWFESKPSKTTFFVQLPSERVRNNEL